MPAGTAPSTGRPGAGHGVATEPAGTPGDDPATAPAAAMQATQLTLPGPRRTPGPAASGPSKARGTAPISGPPTAPRRPVAARFRAPASTAADRGWTVTLRTYCP